MEDVLEAFERLITEIASDTQAIIRTLGDKPVSKQLRDAIAAGTAFKDRYEEAAELGDLEKISEAAKMVGVYGQMTHHASRIKWNGRRCCVD